MNKQLIYSVIVFFVLSSALGAGQFPEVEWAVSAGGGNGINSACDIARDSNGNSYVMGYFEATMYFGELEVTADEDYNIFIAKVNPAGEFLWVNTIEGLVAGWYKGAAIAADPMGNVFVTGSYSGIARFGDIEMQSSSYSLFVSKLDHNGNFLWVQTQDGERCHGWGIALDEAGNIYVTGGYGGVVNFGEDQFESASNGYYPLDDVFVSKLDSDGNFIWTNVGYSYSQEYGNDIDVDSSGNVYIAGCSKSYIDFDGFDVMGSSNYVVKLDADGDFMWAKSIAYAWGGMTSIYVDDEGNVYNIGYFEEITDFGKIRLEPFNDTTDIYIFKMDTDGKYLWANQVRTYYSINRYCDIGIDAGGNIFITGDISGSVYFGKIHLETSNFSDTDIFTAKLDAEGRFIWAKTAGGLDDDQCRAIVVSPDGTAFLAGYFSSLAEFDQIELNSTGVQDIFVAEINQDGEYIWANHAGGTGITDDKGWGIAVDSSGSVYISGIFSGTAYFGDTELVSLGVNDVYIAKLDTDGNYLWAIRAGGHGKDECYRILVDDNDDIFIAGRFYYTGYFGDFTIIPDYGDCAIFIAKLDTDGNFIWVQMAGCTSFCCAYALDVDPEGNCYIGGNFYDTAYFGDIEVTSAGEADVFIARLDQEGNFIWVSTGAGLKWDYIYGIDAGDNYIYITGNFGKNYIDFGDIRLYSLPNGGTIFVTKLDKDGNFLWAVAAGQGTSGETGTDIAEDEDGNCYVTGEFSNFAYFGDICLVGGGTQNAFVTKLDRNGEFLWAKSPQSEWPSEGYSIYADKYGSAYITGYFQKEAYFDDIYIESTDEYDMDAFVTKIDTDGNFLWAKNAGSTGYDAGYGIDVDKYGNSYVTGIFKDTAFIGEHEIVSRGGYDIFTAKISDPTIFSDIAVFTAEGAGNTVDIQWETEWEDEVLGFWLYRLRADKLNPFISYIPVLLNEEIIPGEGTAGEGSSYSYTDYVKNGSKHFYILHIESVYGYMLPYRTLLQWQ